MELENNINTIIEKTKGVPTIFLDIDGCLLQHIGNYIEIEGEIKAPVLPGVLEKIKDWTDKNYFIILTTARKECLRDFTKKQLFDYKINYDLLIMGLGNGPRIVINDCKKDGTCSAFAYSIERNAGLSDIPF